MIDDVQLGPAETEIRRSPANARRLLHNAVARRLWQDSCPHGRIEKSRLENEIRGFAVFLAPARKDDRHAYGTYRANRTIREWI